MFTAIYCVEIFVKVSVYGWKVYADNLRNVFDFTVTILAVASSFMVYYPNDYSDSRLIRMVVMARVLRLVRVLTTVTSFKLLLKVTAEILPAAASVALVLFFLLYFFATLGVQLYGGMVSRDPENPLSYLILDTDFSDNDYWANNFNDMFSAVFVSSLQLPSFPQIHDCYSVPELSFCISCFCLLTTLSYRFSSTFLLCKLLRTCLSC